MLLDETMAEKTREDLLKANRELQDRLSEAEETLRAIRNGEVDAFVGSGPEGERIYTLKGADEAYRLMVQDMAEGALTLTSEGLILFANEQFASILGIPLEDTIGSCFQDFVSPDCRDALSALIARTQTGKQKAELYVQSSAGVVPINISLNRMNQEGTGYVCAVVTDLTEPKRRQTEEALRQQEARFRYLTESMPQKIFTAKPSGDVDYFNAEWMAFTGLKFEQIKDWGWTQFIHPEDLEATLRGWRRALATGEDFLFVHRFRRHDGAYRWHLSRAQALRDDTGKIATWIGSNTDIHEQKETEQELQRANEDLNQFAFAASHDLQEPLRMISVYSQLLLEGYHGQLDGQASVYVNFITQGSNRMRELLADLLAYAQVNASVHYPVEPVDLNIIFRQVLQTIQVMIEENGAVITCAPLPIVRGYPAHFRQLFQNLIGNAIKYRGKDPPRIQVSAEKQDGGVARLAIADNGLGIDAEYHQKVFGVFKRLHGKDVPGTGIGLAICQRVVERYGGRIWVESQVGRGATFYFTLPTVLDVA